MNNILDGIRAEIGAGNCCRSCSRDGCRVSLRDVPRERVVVDADKAFEAHECRGRRCDFILFVLGGGGNLVVVPIELKSGGVDVSDALEQLQEGAAFAERIVPKATGAACRPVLFSGGSIHPADRRKLNRRKIRFRGVDVTVKTGRCDRPRNLAGAVEILNE